MLDWSLRLLVPGEVCYALAHPHILRMVTSVAIGIITGLFLDSAQLVYLLELVAGSDNSADQPVVSAA